MVGHRHHGAAIAGRRSFRAPVWGCPTAAAPPVAARGTRGAEVEAVAGGDEDSCDFGRDLASVRLARGYTQVELAARTGLGARGISDSKRGINVAPRLATLFRLIAGLDLDRQETRRLREVATRARVRLQFGDNVAQRRTQRRRRVSAGG